MVIADTAANDAGLNALGEELRYDTREDRNAFILVFSSPKAAQMWQAVFEEKATKSELAFYDRHFVANYSRNINTGYHHFTIMPKGLNGPQEDIDY